MKNNALKKGTTVFWENDPGDCMYYIRQGRVGVYKDYATVHQKKLTELSRGDHFGEMGLIDCAPRTATVVVLESGTILDRIDEFDFDTFLAENPEKVNLIIQQLSHKLRQTTNDYLEICQRIASAVGETADVDAASNYHFERDQRLREIHRAKATSRNDA
jgi:CRP-like cAMP-binding protein